MTLGAAVVLPALAAEDDDLRAAGLAHHGGTDSGAFNARRANRYLVTVAKHHDIIENNLSAFISGNPLDENCVVFRHAILLAACFYQRIHGFHPRSSRALCRLTC